jgi:hypothetical protein
MTRDYLIEFTFFVRMLFAWNVDILNLPARLCTLLAISSTLHKNLITQEDQLCTYT